MPLKSYACVCCHPSSDGMLCACYGGRNSVFLCSSLFFGTAATRSCYFCDMMILLSFWCNALNVSNDNNLN